MKGTSKNIATNMVPVENDGKDEHVPKVKDGPPHHFCLGLGRVLFIDFCLKLSLQLGCNLSMWIQFLSSGVLVCYSI